MDHVTHDEKTTAELHGDSTVASADAELHGDATTSSVDTELHGDTVNERSAAEAETAPEGDAFPLSD
jgi:hypothetical protein